MKHLGDITKINGAEIEPVEVITFGSPCQDLSVAGKRAGLSGERSGLFMEAVRIFKEMRNCEFNLRRRPAELVRPYFCVWENVPGALSSNNGEDFRAVLEELAHVCDETVCIPRPDKKWPNSGFIVADTWSIAWRIMDAQYFGVPQRRRRISLILDTRGKRAGKILFECQSGIGNPVQSLTPWKEIARNPAKGVGEYDCRTLKVRGGSEVFVISSSPTNVAPSALTITKDRTDSMSNREN